MSVAQLSYVTLGLLAALVFTFLYGTLAPKGRLAFYVAVAFTFPLLGLWLYMINAYRHSTWWPFARNSLVPHALTSLIFLALMGVTLAKASGSLIAKILIGVLTCILWGIVWFYGSLIVACRMGDCI